jgi:hypothetical protein
MADVEKMLQRREQIGDEITQAAGRLGVLWRQQLELENDLYRAAEADGSRTNPFSTATSVMDAICAELTRAGLSLHRGDPQLRLSDLLSGQHTRYRAQRETRRQVAGRSAA